MKIQIGKTLVTAFVVEILAIAVLVIAVALFGPGEAEADQAWAAETGRWLGPLAGFLFCVLGGWFVARTATSDRVIHGLALGVTVALIDVALLVAGGSGFEMIFLISNVGRVVAGAFGGWLTARQSIPIQ